MKRGSLQWIPEQMKDLWGKACELRINSIGWLIGILMLISWF